MNAPQPDAAALSAYVEGLFAPEDEALRAVRQAIVEAGLPEIQISAELGRLLQVLLTAVAARNVLEIGTLAGYSAIWMARALPPGGRVVSLEIDEARARLARQMAARAGVGDRIEVRVGAAASSLADLETQGARFDACFIDADKEGYPRYLAAARRLVRVGGLIMADNALWSGRVLDDDTADEGTRAVQALNRGLAADPGLDATILPVRDGLAVAIVLAPAD
jgi:caffeoyl-CoA O-methyltransferase